MARHVEGPWYRKGTNSWYATLGGRNVLLKVKGKDSRKDGVAAWHRVMASQPSDLDAMANVDSAHVGEPLPPALPKPAPSVRELADLFLADAATRLKPSTVKRYREDMAAMCKAVGQLSANTVTPSHLTKWITGLTVTPTTKAIILRFVSALRVGREV